MSMRFSFYKFSPYDDAGARNVTRWTFQLATATERAQLSSTGGA
jgi:hypothetical protein